MTTVSIADSDTQYQQASSIKCGPGMEKMLRAFPDANRRKEDGPWWYNPDNPTFDFCELENGSIKIYSWTNRTDEEILAMGGLRLSDIRSNGQYVSAYTHPRIDLLSLAHAKRIYWKELESYGLEDGYSYKGYKYVKIAYYNLDGSQHTKIRVRMQISGGFKHCWDEGTPGELIPYGLHKLDMAKEQQQLVIGEGETDAWACWHHGIAYLGIPGATLQKSLKGIDFNAVPVIYIISEPDQFQAMLAKGQSFYKYIHNMLRAEGYTGQIRCINFKQSTGYKDPSELHIQLFDTQQGDQFPTIITQAKEQSIPANDYMPNIRTLEQAIEQKDRTALFREGATLAEVASVDYALYKLRIQDAFGKTINMNDLQRVVSDARKKRERELAGSGNGELGVTYGMTAEAMTYSCKDEPVPLSNFTAQITADIIIDDGAERKRLYEVSTALLGKESIFEIPAKEFPKAEWIDEQLGAKAMVTVGQSMKAHLVNAIKSCSNPEPQHHYAHTGWKEIDGQMVFLHSGGALASEFSQLSQVSFSQKEDLTKNVLPDEMALQAEREGTKKRISQFSQLSQVDLYARVKLSHTLRNYTFAQEYPTEQKAAIRASLKFLDLTQDVVTFPLYASLWRTPLPGVDYSVHYAGASGEGKTEVSTLLQQHFGRKMDVLHLPGSWESSDNSLEGLCFEAKNCLVVIDDFKAKGSQNEQDRLHSKADRIFRQIGNGSARGRLNSNLEQRVSRAPRCMILSTGEDIPKGQSLRARLVVVFNQERITAGENAKKLTRCQEDARSGLYEQAMSCYLAWLAPQMKALENEFSALVAAERIRLAIDGHGRAGTKAANLLLGMKFFLRFAHEAEAITQEEETNYLARCMEVIQHLSDEAQEENEQDKPSEQWRRLLVSALNSKTAHLLTPTGDNPGEEYGWKKNIHQTPQTDGTTLESFSYSGGGSPIGWIDGEDIYLLPEATYTAVRARGNGVNDQVVTMETTLRKFLLKDGLLASTDLKTPRKSITVRRTLQKQQQTVLHIKKGMVYPEVPPILPPEDLTKLTNSSIEDAPQAEREVSQVAKIDLTKLTKDLTTENHEVALQADSEISQVDASEKADLTKDLTKLPEDLTKPSEVEQKSAPRQLESQEEQVTRMLADAYDYLDNEEHGDIDKRTGERGFHWDMKLGGYKSGFIGAELFKVRLFELYTSKPAKLKAAIDIMDRLHMYRTK